MQVQKERERETVKFLIGNIAFVGEPQQSTIAMVIFRTVYTQLAAAVACC
jgi:hypothetical protein